MGQRQSEGFREQALRKVFDRGDRTIDEIAAELGMNLLTLKGWMKVARREARRGTTRVPESSGQVEVADTHSAAVRLELLLASAGLSGEALQAWCRERGVYAHQLSAWKAGFAQDGDSRVKPLKQERDALRQERDQLQRQVARKDKALAEAAALLVLSKKFQALLEGEVE